MSKKHKIVKRLLVCVLSVAVILAFTPTSLLAYADDNEGEAATYVEKAEAAETYAEEHAEAEETLAVEKEKATDPVKVINPEWSVMIKKVWVDVPKDNQTEVKVLLKIGLEEFGPFALNASNDWTTSVEDIAMSSLVDPRITVIEGSYVNENGEQVFRETTDYKVEYSQQTDSANKTVWIYVKNSSKNVEDPPPSDDEDTTETTEPTGSSNPDKQGDKSPQTGDNSNLALAYWLLLLSGCAGAMAVMYRRKKTQ